MVAVTSNHVARILPVPDRDRLVQELLAIEKTLDAQVPAYQHPFRKKGSRVRVKYGPLEGVEGVISRFKGKYRLVLNVSFVGQAVAVDVDMDQIEAA